MSVPAMFSRPISVLLMRSLASYAVVPAVVVRSLRAASSCSCKHATLYLESSALQVSRQSSADIKLCKHARKTCARSVANYSIYFAGLGTT